MDKWAKWASRSFKNLTFSNLKMDKWAKWASKIIQKPKPFPIWKWTSEQNEHRRSFKNLNLFQFENGQVSKMSIEDHFRKLTFFYLKMDKWAKWASRSFKNLTFSNLKMDKWAKWASRSFRKLTFFYLKMDRVSKVSIEIIQKLNLFLFENG